LISYLFSIAGFPASLRYRRLFQQKSSRLFEKIYFRKILHKKAELVQEKRLFFKKNIPACFSVMMSELTKSTTITKADEED
jgi:hypothetical protein